MLMGGNSAMQNTAVIGKKSNKAFMILSALGILFVVDSHVGPNFSVKFGVFPYDSFYMPMFAFISGYFFSGKHIQSWNSVIRFTSKKIKNLLIPYFLWIVFYGIVTGILRNFDILEIGVSSLKDLIYCIATSGTSFAFNDPAWFVPLLFCVSITYVLIRKVMGRHWNHYFTMIVFALLGAGAVAISRTDRFPHIAIMLLKISCFLQYYHLGVLFREKLEKWFDRLHPLLICISAIAINCLLMSVYGSGIYVPMYANMEGYALDAAFVPLIASISGISFWLKISKCLVPILGQSKIINFISDNTFFFMTHHLGVKHIFLALLIGLNNAGIMDFSGINLAQFRLYAWYTYPHSFLCSLLCLLFTVAMLIPLCALYLKIQRKITGFINLRHMQKNRDQ